MDEKPYHASHILSIGKKPGNYDPQGLHDSVLTNVHFKWLANVTTLISRVLGFSVSASRFST